MVTHIESVLAAAEEPRRSTGPGEDRMSSQSRMRRRENEASARHGASGVAITFPFQVPGAPTPGNVDDEHWSRVASEWIAWARAPGHGAFWAYREALIAFVGRGEGEALDVGCGEGRVSRELKPLGYRVTASDPVRELVNAARKARSADDYVIASAGNLPFEDASFGLVMAYNVLMDVAAVAATLKEIRRVLRPAGLYVISIVHSFSDRGQLRHHGGHFPLCHTRRVLWLEALRRHGRARRPANAFRRVVKAIGSLRDRIRGCGAGDHVRSRTSSPGRRSMESPATLDPNPFVSPVEGTALGIAMIGWRFATGFRAYPEPDNGALKD